MDQINRMDRLEFVDTFGAVYEHSPWVAERSLARRPFANRAALVAAMHEVVTGAPREAQLALIRAHPELAGTEAATGRLTAHSSGEQARLRFNSLGRTESRRMAELNRRYRDRHGFPCVIALALHATRESVFDELERRICNDTESEVARALEQIGHIARGRLEKLVRPVAEV
jgi:OHCU decarboxylase